MSHSDDEPLRRHRRALAWAALLLALGAIGRGDGRPSSDRARPGHHAPAIGDLDAAIERSVAGLRVAPFTWFAMLLSVLGGGLVTIPLRIVAIVVLAVRRRWLRLTGFALTWIAAEATLMWLKPSFHRGRPPDPLVATERLLVPVGPCARGRRDDRRASSSRSCPPGRGGAGGSGSPSPTRSRCRSPASTWARTGSPTSSWGPCSAPASRSRSRAIAVEVRDLIFQAEHRPIPDDSEPETAAARPWPSSRCCFSTPSSERQPDLRAPDRRRRRRRSGSGARTSGRGTAGRRPPAPPSRSSRRT